MEPVPVGTRVYYHDSHAHGFYIVTGHQVPELLFTQAELDLIPLLGAALDEAYPDHVAYIITRELSREGTPSSWNQESWVQRGSLTVANAESS